LVASRDHRHAQLHALLGQAHQAVDRQALHAGHAGHVLHAVVAVVHEHRQDQVAGMQVVLAHQGAGEGVAAQAARAAGRKGGQGGQGHGVNAPGSMCLWVSFSTDTAGRASPA
jgi:hypothetical protein